MAKLNEVTQRWPYAAITIGNRINGASFMRPAAFVYDVPGGFAWVEPAYLDPYGASSTLCISSTARSNQIPMRRRRAPSIASRARTTLGR